MFVKDLILELQKYDPNDICYSSYDENLPHPRRSEDIQTIGNISEQSVNGGLYRSPLIFISPAGSIR